MKNKKFRLRLHLQYEGTDFGGWQKQKQAKPTVQGELEKVLAKILDRPVTTIGSGRTDAGVHAREQVVHFDMEKNPQNFNLLNALNGLLPKGITATECFLAPSHFHALHNAREKTYKYYILNSPQPNALNQRFCLWERRPLKLQWLRTASEYLLGEQDFAAFQNTGTPVSHTTRKLTQAQWSQDGSNLQFSLTGNGFLKQMVRNIVGTLMDLHLAGAPASDLAGVLAGRDRSRAGTTAPPQGLFLHAVSYPPDLDKECRKL